MKRARGTNQLASGRIENVLGPLGAAIMRIAYELDEFTVATMLPRLREAQGRESAYTTVLTVLSRLYVRGLLERRKVGRQYLYRASADESTTIERLSQRAVNEVLDKYGSAAMRQFAARLADLDPELSARLVDLAEGKEVR